MRARRAERICRFKVCVGDVQGRFVDSRCAWVGRDCRLKMCAVGRGETCGEDLQIYLFKVCVGWDGLQIKVCVCVCV